VVVWETGKVPAARKMKAAGSSKTLALIYESTWGNIPEESNLEFKILYVLV
jgi:hypothetical protein